MLFCPLRPRILFAGLILVLAVASVFAVEHSPGVVLTAWTTMAVVLWFRLHHAERELAATQAAGAKRFAQLAAELPQACFQVNREGRVVFWNTAAELIFGYTREESLGRFLHELVAPEHSHEFWRKAFARFAATGTGRAVGRTVERVAMRKDGTYFPVEVSLCALKDADGWSALGFAQDVSRRKELESQLRQARQRSETALRELKQAVHEAHRNALHARLATKSKSDFISHMAQHVHSTADDIRTLLRQGSTTEALEKISTMVSVADEISGYSQMEAKKLQLQCAPFDLASVLDHSAAMLVRWADEKKLEARYTIDPEVPSQALGDAVRIQQILTNLINNAIRFTEKGRVEFSAELVRRSDTQIALRCTVTDTGVGISEERQHTIFAPKLRQTHEAEGLGLAISKQLIEMMGGQIRVRSTPGGGSTFVFTIFLDLPA